MKEQDFEILLSRLAWEDISEGERAQLEREIAQSPERAERHRRFTETLSVLGNLEAGELEIPELEQAYFGGTAGGDKLVDDKVAGGGGKFRFKNTALAAAAAVMLVVGVALYLAQRAPGVETHLTHASGECRAGNSSLEKGAKFKHVEVWSGPDSVCDVRIAYAGKLHVRLLENSGFSYTIKNHSLTIKLEQGELLLDSEKLPAHGRLRIHSPGHSIEVLGTRLALNRRRHHKLQLELIRGRARVKSAHYLRLHGLRNGVHGGHYGRLATELPELFRESTQIMEPGNRLGFEHPRDFREKTASLFNGLETHLRRAGHSSDATGAHHVPRVLSAKLKATFKKHPASGHAYFAATLRGQPGKLSASRVARLQAHFDAVAAHAAAHDARQ